MNVPTVRGGPNHSGMRIAFLFDDEVLSNIVWQGPYGMYTGARS